MGCYVLGDLVRQFFPPDEVGNALYVIDRESSNNPSARNTNGEDSRGLMQINVEPAANPGYASRDLYDPYINIQTGREMWGRSGWWPWTTAVGAQLQYGAIHLSADQPNAGLTVCSGGTGGGSTGGSGAGASVPPVGQVALFLFFVLLLRAARG